MANKDTSKTWFETGDFPTQVQFAQVFEWLRWKDETIDVSDVTGLAAILATLGVPIEKYTVLTGGTNITYSVPVGYVNSKIWIVPYSSCVTTVTDTDNAVNMYVGVLGVDDIDPAKGLEIDMSIFAPASIRHIQVGPMPVGSIVYVMKTKIF